MNYVCCQQYIKIATMYVFYYTKIINLTNKRNFLAQKKFSIVKI